MTTVERIYLPVLAIINNAEYLLQDGVIGIRPFRAEDGARLHEAVCESFDQLHGRMTWCDTEYSSEDCFSFVTKSTNDWEQGRQYNFGIFDVTQGTLLGSVGLSQVDRRHNYANVGYWVRTGHTRHGVATAATRLLARFGLTELALDRLEFLVACNNPASKRVAEKIGAKPEGLLRKRLVLAGKTQDAILYSLVREDLEPALLELI